MEVQKAPEEDRILMKDFPVEPGDVMVATLECHDCGDVLPAIGEVKSVFSRNPDPGVTVELKTVDELLAHIGGEHNNVKLSRYDSMWAHVLFLMPCCFGSMAVDFLTYELVSSLKKNELAKIGPELFFANFHNFVREARRRHHKPE